MTARAGSPADQERPPPPDTADAPVSRREGSLRRRPPGRRAPGAAAGLVGHASGDPATLAEPELHLGDAGVLRDRRLHPGRGEVARRRGADGHRSGGKVPELEAPRGVHHGGRAHQQLPSAAAAPRPHAEWGERRSRGCIPHHPATVPPRESSTVASSPGRATTARGWVNPSRAPVSRWRPGPGRGGRTPVGVGGGLGRHRFLGSRARRGGAGGRRRAPPPPGRRRGHPSGDRRPARAAPAAPSCTTTRRANGPRSRARSAPGRTRGGGPRAWPRRARGG